MTPVRGPGGAPPALGPRGLRDARHHAERYRPLLGLEAYDAMLAGYLRLHGACPDPAPSRALWREWVRRASEARLARAGPVGLVRGGLR